MRTICGVCLLLVSIQAHAAIICAKTGNELGNAMALTASNGADDEIRVVEGTHTSNLRAPESPQWRVDASTGTDKVNSITISGGWNAANNCATQSSLNPAATVLDAQLMGPVFAYALAAGDPFTGTFTLRNLTFNRGKSFDGQDTGIAIVASLSGAGSIVVDNVHVVNGQSSASSVRALGIAASGSGTIRLRNSITSFNSFTGSSSSMVRVQPLDSVVAYVSNNSIFNNSTTSQTAGLDVIGVANVSNNAVADNTSTANPYYQFHSNAPTSLTLVNNHFGTEHFSNGAPFSEVNTTTGNAFWAPLGVERIPLEASPLRDSGNNAPTGGVLSIDFRGNPRIVNTTIDRGASEAPAPTTVVQGPIVTDLTPVKFSTTFLYGESGQSALGEIHFNVSGGDAGGLTLIECQVTSGTVLIGAFDSQWVATGGTAEPVLVGFDNLTTTQQTGVVFCNFKRNGVVNGSNAAYTFKSGLETPFENGFE